MNAYVALFEQVFLSDIYLCMGLVLLLLSMCVHGTILCLLALVCTCCYLLLIVQDLSLQSVGMTQMNLPVKDLCELTFPCHDISY